MLRRIRLTRHFSRTYPVRRLGIAIPGYPGIPAEFSNPVFSGLAASNPGITELENSAVMLGLQSLNGGSNFCECLKDLNQL